MIERYQHSDIQKIWNDLSRFEFLWKVELSALKVMSRKKIIPIDEATIKKFESRVEINIQKIHEIEKRTQHEVLAFVEYVAEQCGADGKWIHYGLTSSDVLDTALSCQIRASAQVLKKLMEDVFDGIQSLIKVHGRLLIMGRTHGMSAQPMLLEHKFAMWGTHLAEACVPFFEALKNACCAKLSGAVGNYPVLSREIEIAVAHDLGLRPATVSSQVVGRHLHGAVVTQLAIMLSVIEKIAVDIRHHHCRGEIQEGFAKGQMGSSAMPHKQNPIACENFSGMARLARGYAQMALENIPLWLERDISHSSVERVVFPDIFHVAAYTLNRFSGVLKNLQVNSTAVQNSLKADNDVSYSQHVLLRLLSEEKDKTVAYQKVQELSFKAKKENISFVKLVGQAYPKMSWSDLKPSIWEKELGRSTQLFQEAVSNVKKQKV